MSKNMANQYISYGNLSMEIRACQKKKEIKKAADIPSKMCISEIRGCTAQM